MKRVDINKKTYRLKKKLMESHRTRSKGLGGWFCGPTNAFEGGLADAGWEEAAQNERKKDVKTQRNSWSDEHRPSLTAVAHCNRNKRNHRSFFFRFVWSPPPPLPPPLLRLRSTKRKGKKKNKIKETRNQKTVGLVAVSWWCSNGHRQMQHSIKAAKVCHQSFSSFPTSINITIYSPGPPPPASPQPPWQTWTFPDLHCEFPLPDSGTQKWNLLCSK